MARELPIFPLPIVLFPGAPQPLHIFEPRYRQLLQDCLAGDQRFGIAYVAPDPAPDADPVPRPGDVGCVALIRSNQPLPDGRSNVLTVGERRFVLRCWISSTHPYRVAEIEEFDDDPTDATEVTTLAADVREGFGRLARALGVLTEREDEEIELPADPQLLSFQVGASPAWSCCPGAGTKWSQSCGCSPRSAYRSCLGAPARVCRAARSRTTTRCSWCSRG